MNDDKRSDSKFDADNASSRSWRNKGRSREKKSSSESDPPVKQAKKVKPDHFVSLQITDPEIHKKIGEIQEHIVSEKEELKSVLISLTTLHITLMVIHLGKEIPLESITKAMNNCVKEIKRSRPASLTLDIEGLGHFQNTVLFAKVAPGPALDQLKSIAEVVDRCFTECDFPSTDERREFKPHLTVMKLFKDPSLYRKGIKKIDPRFYEKFMTQYMGSQTVTSLQLCSMDEPKTDEGYYHIIHQVALEFEDSHNTETLVPSQDDVAGKL